MFNLFGSLFFGKAVPEQPLEASQETTNEASTQTSSKTHTHTQTMMEEEQTQSPLAAAVECQQTPVAAFIGPLNYNELHMPHTSDWVIVDRSEEADKCSHRLLQLQQHTTLMKTEAGINTSTIMQQDNNEQTVAVAHSEANLHTMQDLAANDAILGSFFEKNEHESEEDSRRYSIRMRTESSDDESAENEASHVAEQVEAPVTVVAPQKSANDWQITPLPCLTSTTWSQRSLVTEDPLENLLIEHPSMSVFVTATSSSSNSPNKEAYGKRKHVATVKKQPQQVILDEDETDMLTMLFKSDETPAVVSFEFMKDE